MNQPLPETLLAQQDFVRGIVRSLLRGAEGEDDLVQGTWLRAITKPPRELAHARHWLAKVARNLVRDHQRSSSRRKLHERRASQNEALPSAADVVQREQDRKRVVDAVLRLGDPYRTAVLLRFMDDLQPKEIGERLGIPPATVRSHLRRGLEMLRLQLDEDYGGRNRWLVVMAPFSSFLPASIPTTGAVLMSTKSKVLVLASLVLLTGVILSGILGLGGDDSKVPEAPRVAEFANLDPRRSPELASQTTASTELASPSRTTVDAIGKFQLHGSVTNEGEPIAGLELAVQWYEGYSAEGAAREYSVTTDTHGCFAWLGQHAKSASALCVVCKNPRVQMADNLQIVTPDQDDAHLELTAVPLDCELFGVVSDESGERIPNARLRSKGPTVTANSQGEFSIAVGRGHSSRSVIVWASGFSPRVVDTSIPATADRYQLDFTLQRGARIPGRVVDENGIGISKASVTTSTRRYKVTSDTAGAFVLDSLDPTTDHHIEVELSGYVRAGKSFPVGTSDAVLVMKRGLEVHGRVTGPLGRGIAGVEVSIHHLTGRGSQATYSRADGEFSIPGLAPGSSYVSAKRRGYVRLGVTCDVQAEMDDLSIVLERGHYVKGRVRDMGGAPVAGALVRAMVGPIGRREPGPGGVRTDTEGRFELSGLDLAKQLDLSVLQRGFVPAVEAKVAIDSEGVEIRLQRGASIAGRVMNRQTGQVIDVFNFRVSQTDDPSAFWRAPTNITGTDGYWESKGAIYKSGQVLYLLFEAEGFGPKRLQIAATVDPARDRTLVMMERAAELVGVVREEGSGKPISGASIKLFDASVERFDSVPSSMVRWAKSDAGGHFATTSVGVGSKKLVAIHPDYTDKVTDAIEVLPGVAKVDLVVQMGAGARVSGRIVGFEGQELDVHIMSYEGPANSQRKKLGGLRTFAFEGVGKGRQLIALHTKGHSFLRAGFIVIKDGDVEDFVFREVEGPCSVRVIVKGLAAGEACIRPKNPGAGAIRMFNFDGGGFSQSGLKPGVHRIRVEAGGKEVEVEHEVRIGHDEVVVIDFGA